MLTQSYVIYCVILMSYCVTTYMGLGQCSSGLTEESLSAYTNKERCILMDASMINRRRTSRSAERAVAVEAVSSLDASAWNSTERLRGYTEAAQLHCATAYMSEQYDFSEGTMHIKCRIWYSFLISPLEVLCVTLISPSSLH